MERDLKQESRMHRNFARSASMPPTVGRSRSWRIFAFVITLVATAWVGLLVAQSIPDIAAHYREIEPRPLLIGVAFAITGAWFAFLAFATLLPVFGINGYPLVRVANLYFTAQLLKHLPGRIWGIGYQWALSDKRESVGSWVRANLVHLLFATYFALWSSAVVIASSSRVLAGVFVFFMGAVFCILLWEAPRWISSIPWVSFALRRRLGAHSSQVWATPTSAQKSKILFLFVASSLFLYASWYANGLAFGSLGGIGGVRMCAYYMIAWFVGYISLLTPSGLGVRELVFAWLAQDFPNETVVLMAIVGRLSLLIVDLVFGVLFSAVASRQSAR